LGFIAGLAALVIIHFMFLLGVAAGGAGFLIVVWQAAERCVEFNRQPNAECSMGDHSPFAATGLAVLGLGVGPTVYAATHPTRRRPASA
jgi:hypothetical protein